MCFSATASFTVAAALVPVGICALVVARRVDSNWLALASYPVFFAIQQVAEGFLWLALADGNQTGEAIAARAFLFFSHFFWLFWVPFSVIWIEREVWRRQVLSALAVFGAAFGLSICLPSLLIGDWLAVEVVRGSLEYKTRLIYDGWVDRGLLEVIYIVIIIIALTIPTDMRIRAFAALIAASLIFTFVYYPYAYISVWCFLAAILSAYLGLIVLSIRRNGAARTGRR
jgi:hypothetical protein